MSIGRFLFGSGWWILWHLTFYAAILLFVGLTLVLFGQELKAPGQKPDTPSPGSLIVFLIALTLGGLTLINARLFAPVLAGRWYVKAAVALGLTGLVRGVGVPLNSQLATAQSRPAFYANLAYAAVGVAGNLVLMWLARTRPPGSLPPLGG